MKIIIGDWAARAVYAAAATGLADCLVDGPRTAGELAARTGTNATALERFLRYLTALGVVNGDDSGYSLGPLGQLLCTDAKGSLRDYALIAGEEFHRAWTDVLHTVRTGEPAFAHVFGTSFFDYLEKHPDRAEVFDRAMAGNTSLFDAVPGAYDFGSHRLLVDVGGGRGELVTRVLAVHRGLRALVYDTEQTVGPAAAALAEAGCADRSEVRAGSFLESVPEGGDAYLLARVLMNWSDEDCARILSNCAEAAEPGARLLLVERVVAPDVDNALLLSHDTLMYMLFGGGGIRTLDGVTALLDAAGFTFEGKTALPQHFSLITATRR